MQPVDEGRKIFSWDIIKGDSGCAVAPLVGYHFRAGGGSVAERSVNCLVPDALSRAPDDVAVYPDDCIY